MLAGPFVAQREQVKPVSSNRSLKFYPSIGGLHYVGPASRRNAKITEMDNVTETIKPKLLLRFQRLFHPAGESHCAVLARTESHVRVFVRLQSRKQIQTSIQGLEKIPLEVQVRAIVRPTTVGGGEPAATCSRNAGASRHQRPSRSSSATKQRRPSSSRCQDHGAASRSMGDALGGSNGKPRGIAMRTSTTASPRGTGPLHPYFLLESPRESGLLRNGAWRERQSRRNPAGSSEGSSPGGNDTVTGNHHRAALRPVFVIAGRHREDPLAFVVLAEQRTELQRRFTLVFLFQRRFCG